MNLLYQNNETGDALDITTLVTSAKWTTKRSGSPASLELSVLKDDALQWSPGGILALKDGNTGIFCKTSLPGISSSSTAAAYSAWPGACSTRC